METTKSAFKTRRKAGTLAGFFAPAHATLIDMNRPLWKDLVLLCARSIVTVITIVAVIFVGAAALGALWETDSYISDGSCNIAVLPVEGTILPFTSFAGFDLVVTPGMIDEFMATAESDPNIAGVLVEINSPGGTPVASHRIAERLHNSTLPVVGLIGDIGASGGYMVAAASDFLIASAMSDVGSIGVNMSYVEESQKNEEEGLTYVQLMTGKFKDTGTPNRAITDEERELLLGDLDIIHNEFIDIITKYRELDRFVVENLADGSTMPGRRAADAELIDAIGDRTQATIALSALLDITIESVQFCEYETSLLPI